MRTKSLFVSTGVSMLTLALSLSLTSCLNEKKEAPKEAQMMPPVTVDVAKPVIKDVPVFKEWVGTLTGKVNATILPQVSGYLHEQVYQNGGVVKKGDVLFKIDDRTFKAALEQANADLAKAQASLVQNQLDVERYTPLVKTNAVSQKQLDDAMIATRESQAAVAACQAAVDQAQLNLGFTVVQAPIEGIAGIAKAQIGDLVSPSGQSLTNISSVNPIRLDFAITEQDWLNTASQQSKDEKQPSIENSPNLEIILSTDEVYPFKGKAVAVDREVNSTTGTINIIGDIENPQLVLRPGMFVRVRANVNTIRGALVVPAKAVIAQQGAYYVVTVDKEGFPMILPVKPGLVFGQEQIITPMFEGTVTADSTIVVNGLFQAMQRAPKLPGDTPKGKLETKPYEPEALKPIIAPKDEVKKLKETEAKPATTEPAPEVKEG